MKWLTGPGLLLVSLYLVGCTLSHDVGTVSEDGGELDAGPVAEVDGGSDGGVLPGACYQNTDCPCGEVCQGALGTRQGTCQTGTPSTCTSTASCATGYDCLPQAQQGRVCPFSTCQLAYLDGGTGDCTADSQCPCGHVCTNNQCVPQPVGAAPIGTCTTDNDCVNSFPATYCLPAVRVPQPPSTPIPGMPGASCGYNQCTRPGNCSSNAQCSCGEFCDTAKGVCITMSTGGALAVSSPHASIACTSQAECSADGVSRACVPAMRGSVSCAHSECQ